MIYSRKAEVQTEVSAFNYFWFSFKFELFNVHQSLMFMSFIFVYLYGGIDQFFHCPLSTLLLPDPVSSFRLTKTTRWLDKQTDTSTRFQVPPLHPPNVSLSAWRPRSRNSCPCCSTWTLTLRTWTEGGCTSTRQITDGPRRRSVVTHHQSQPHRLKKDPKNQLKKCSVHRWLLHTEHDT